MAYTYNGNKLGFLIGSQANLDVLRTTAKNSGSGVSIGAFYLTNDSNRLYYGKDANNIVPVNQGVEIVTNVTDLPPSSTAIEGGHFYYVTNGNILAIASRQGWIQINAPSNFTDFTHDVTNLTGGANGITITTTAEIGETVKVTSFDIEGSNVTIVEDPEHPNRILVTGDVYTHDATQIVETIDGSAINVGANIHLRSTINNTDDILKLKAGTNMHSIVVSDDNIVINGVDTFIETISLSPQSTGFKASFERNDGAVGNSNTLDPTITLGTHVEAAVHFANGNATLPVYTKSEIDNLIKHVDAMSYKGTLGGAGATITSLPTTGVASGDTYKVTQANFIQKPNVLLNSPDPYCHVGDLLIATSSTATVGNSGEQSDGTIAADNLVWTYVPSGDDTDTRYTYSAIQHGLSITEDTADNDIVGKIEFSSTGTITLTDTQTGTHGLNDGAQFNTINLDLTTLHGDITYSTLTAANTPTTELNTKMSSNTTGFIVNTIGELTVDQYGRVLSVTKKAYEILDTHNHLQSVASTITNIADGVKLGTTITTDDEVIVSNDIKYVSANKNLTVVASANDTITFDMIWGTF